MKYKFDKRAKSIVEDTTTKKKVSLADVMKIVDNGEKVSLKEDEGNISIDRKTALTVREVEEIGKL
tara:strand:- start:772 stop:969 length:198 start_codon:yes stop_codon:yes gene_type:complete